LNCTFSLLNDAIESEKIGDKMDNTKVLGKRKFDEEDLIIIGILAALKLL
jgi:hypothetical protein